MSYIKSLLRLVPINLKSKSRSSSSTREIPLPVRRSGQSFKLSDFLVISTVGKGTFGRVRLVKSFGDGKCYAMKVMKKVDVVRMGQLDHVVSEVSIMSVIRHKFLVDMVGHFQDSNRMYIVMEYVPGGDMFGLLRNEGRLEESSAIFYVAEIIEAIGYLHDIKIGYRDLKPENILLTGEGRPMMRACLSFFFFFFYCHFVCIIVVLTTQEK